MEFKTYKDWNKFGYYVRKGSKSQKRDENGIPLFSENQVEKKVYSRGPSEYTGVRYEENIDFWTKASPYGLMDRVIKYDIDIPDDKWRRLCDRIREIEG